MQNLAGVSHVVCTYVEGHRNSGPTTLNLGARLTLETRSSPCYHTKFGHSRSNHISIIGVPRNLGET